MIGGLVVGAIAALPLGMFVEARMNLHHWLRDGYCPVCDRVDCAREHSLVDGRSASRPGAWTFSSETAPEQLALVRAVTALEAIDGADPDVALSEAEQVLLATVPLPVRQAYERVIGRARQ